MGVFRYRVAGALRTIPRHLASYRVERYIGSGKFGDVFRVTHQHLREPRALKICTNPHIDLNQFRHEARRMVRLKLAKPKPPLDHLFTNISDSLIRIDDFGPPSRAFPFAWYMMEFVKGRTLKNIVQGGSWFNQPLLKRLHCFMTIVAVIEAAMRAGVPHYDLHLGNIMITNSPRHFTPKVLDFGMQLSGQVRRPRDVRTALYEALDDILHVVFRRDAEFIDYWQETVIRSFKTVEAIPDLFMFRILLVSAHARTRNSPYRKLVPGRILGSLRSLSLQGTRIRLAGGLASRSLLRSLAFSKE